MRSTVGNDPVGDLKYTPSMYYRTTVTANSGSRAPQTIKMFETSHGARRKTQRSDALALATCRRMTPPVWLDDESY